MARYDDLLDLMNLEDNVVSDNINDYSINLYGEGGAGKSSFANALKRKLGNSVSFFFEPRQKGLGGIKAIPCLSWDYFLQYIRQMQKLKREGKKLPFDNIIIDSVDSAYEKATKYMLDNNPEWNGTLQGDYGARFAAVGQEFKGAIDELRKMGFIITYLTHDTSKEEHDVNNAAFNKATPIVANQIKDMAIDQVDLIMYLQKITVDVDGVKKEMRRLWLKNNPYITLKTPIYGLPDYIDYANVNEGVDKFLAAFNKGVEITRAMYENGEDVSNPNGDNLKVPEVSSHISTTDFDDLADDEVNEVVVDIEDVKKDAVKVRDAMLETMERKEVAVKLKQYLGTTKIAECNDVDKLKMFIEDNK